MPKTNSKNKTVHSFRISDEGARQLKMMATVMGRSEGDILEIALDRMYREEIRFNHVIREKEQLEDQYRIGTKNEERDESVRNDS
jgi:predicted transcriptional regulator